MARVNGKTRDSGSKGVARVSRSSYVDADPCGSAPEADGDDVDSLLRRMRSGSRTAAALFVTRYGPRIRRRIRGKLSPAMRRLFDSQDILSTLGRRLDQLVLGGGVTAVNENELWALIFRIANNAVIDKARFIRRLRSVEGEDSAFARDLASRFRDAIRHRDQALEIEITNALTLFEDGADREILFLWLTGTRHHEIAEHVRLSAPTVRKRWQKIKTRLRRHFAGEIEA